MTAKQSHKELGPLSTNESLSQKLWLASEVAQYLRVALSTIYAWVEADKIPYIKINGAIRFVEKELEQWIHGHNKTGSLPQQLTSKRRTARRHHSSSLALRESGQRAIQQRSLSSQAHRLIMLDGKTAHQKGGTDGRI